MYGPLRLLVTTVQCLFKNHGERQPTDPVQVAYYDRVRDAARMWSDGCTRASDVYLDCCYEHDIAYEFGVTVDGSPTTKREADAAFRRCIQARSCFGRCSLVAWVRWVAVHFFGRGVWTHPVKRS